MTDLPRLRAHMELARATLHGANHVAGKSKSLASRARAMRLTTKADRMFNAAVDAFNSQRRNQRKEAAE